MRLAAIADIHGNCLALEAVLADIAGQGVDQVVNLGDHLSGPLEAARTADSLMAQDITCIRGNHDRWLLETDPDEMGISDIAAFRELTPAHLDWLRTLPATDVVADEIFLCHGTPASDVTYWLETVSAAGDVLRADPQQIEHHAADTDFPIILCAHTHLPRMVQLADGRLVVNPGSVGCPAYTDDKPTYHIVASGTPDACYAILEKGEPDARWSVTHRWVPYDNGAMSRMAQARGRPDWAQGLATGWIS